jgi:hypothetical protein
MSSGITPEYWEACRLHSNLDAHDCIAIGGYDLDRFGGRHQPEVAAFTDHNATGEPLDAGERYVEEGKDPPGGRRSNDLLQEPHVVSWLRAARVDERRAAAAGEAERVDTERSAAPIDMRMQVDEAGHDDQATDVLDLAPSSSAPIPATRPFWKPTSITESTPCGGAITLPPRRTRSSCIKITFQAWNPLGCH